MIKTTGMVKVTKATDKKEIEDIMFKLFEQQKKLEESDTTQVIFSLIPIRYAVKNNICFSNLLTHPVALVTKKFFDIINEYSNKESLELIKNIITYEVTADADKTYLAKEQLDKVIKFYRKEEKKLERRKKIPRIEESKNKKSKSSNFNI